MEVTAHTIGLFPRSAFDDVADVTQSQRAAGIQVVVDGQLGWEYGLASPVLAAGGVTAGDPVTTIQGASTAPRPIVKGPVTADTTTSSPFQFGASHGDSSAVIVPGPYTAAAMVEDRYYDTESELLAAMAHLLATELESGTDPDTVIVHEPRLATDPPTTGQAAIPDALDTVVDATDATVALIPYGGVLTDRVHAHVLDADIDVLGYDFIADHDQALELIAEYGTTDGIAICGLDVTTRGVPTTLTLEERIDWVSDRIPEVMRIESAALVPNHGLTNCSRDRVGPILQALGDINTGEPQ